MDWVNKMCQKPKFCSTIKYAAYHHTWWSFTLLFLRFQSSHLPMLTNRDLAEIHIGKKGLQGGTWFPVTHFCTWSSISSHNQAKSENKKVFACGYGWNVAAVVQFQCISKPSFESEDLKKGPQSFSKTKKLNFICCRVDSRANFGIKQQIPNTKSQLSIVSNLGWEQLLHFLPSTIK